MTLHILWTNNNKESFISMISLYALNSVKHGWWQKVNLILWGASVELVLKDPQIQTEILELKNNGISLEACLDCCNQYEATNQFQKMGIDVKFMGRTLTEYLKSKNDKVITF
ncbi:MAG: DsrE family protein [Bacteroidales bacterium]|nr:DsrE family protein [Bacteroidales bacterium]